MSHRTLLYLQDMLRYSNIAVSLVVDVTREDFEENLEKQLAVTRVVELIGEAAKSVPKEIRDLAPEIPGVKLPVRGTN